MTAVIRLSLVTPGPTVDPAPCTNSMLCICPDCRAEAAALSQRGGQGAGNASPFKNRRAA